MQDNKQGSTQPLDAGSGMPLSIFLIVGSRFGEVEARTSAVDVVKAKLLKMQYTETVADMSG